MKKKTFLALFCGILLTSCATVSTVSDYDRGTSFEEYKTFAFYKPGIDQVQISDLDKKRILRAIEAEMLAMGFTKSENPDVIVSFFTNEKEVVNVYNNYWGWGWGGWYGPYWGGWYGGIPYTTVSSHSEGQLYIDLIDAHKRSLVWQGRGQGRLVVDDPYKKDKRVQDFVSAIFKEYPPTLEDKKG